MDSGEIKSLLFSFRGRINRGKWWLALVIFIVYGVLASAVAGVILAGSFAGSGFGVGVMVGLGVVAIAYLVALYAGIAVGVKRLHDRNKSGWWIVLFYIVPGVLGAVGEISSDESPVTLLLALITLVLYVWMFVELACLRGTVGPNKYGPDPLEADETQPAATA